MRAARFLPIAIVTFLTASGVNAASAEADSAAASAGSGCARMPAIANLNGVAANSASDAWAVGSFSNRELLGSRTLIEHWDGARWCRVASPNVGALANGLNGVTAISPADAWAVGSYFSAKGGTSTLIEHWNGTTWSRVPSPNPSGKRLYNYLAAVAARSSSSVWAVGNYAAGTGGQDALILHWNGTAWKQVKSPNPLLYNYLRAASAARFGAWAVGNSDGQTFTLHRIGTTWIQSASPVEPVNIFLSGLAMTSGSNGWAVGSDNNPHLPTTLILRWNGGAWSEVASPKGASDGLLQAVSATSASNAWAVGQAGGLYSSSTMILHWNGSSWQQVAAPNLGGSGAWNVLYGVAATSRANAWAIGTWSGSTTGGTMILHWNGTTWTVAAKS